MSKIKVKNWYVQKYPNDVSIHKCLNDSITFEDLIYDLYWRRESNQFYKLLFKYGSDSIVRENVFEEIAIILNIDYDDVYGMWLGTAYESDSFKIDRYMLELK